ncbi:hypothetical protein GF325_00400, partial [Candidatus Bathyarchaeota archaeon]|nr:hypothetical protein [Candidatus Bathyarchaeota archaeon]
MIWKKSSRTGFAGSMVSFATIITMACMVSIFNTTAIKPVHPGKGITPAPMPATVIIDGNSALDGFCGGNGTNGTPGNPHVIENITFIMDDDMKDLLVIKNTNLHLIIRNCTFLGNSTFTGTNLLIENVSNTIVQNCSFIHGVDQLELSHVNNVSVTTCSFENGTSGIKLSHVDSCKVNASWFVNGDYFMYLESMVTNLTIGDNNASNALDFFHMDDPDLEHLSAYQVNNNNSVNGLPLYYLVNETDMNVAGDAWAVYIFNSSNITVLDQDWEARLPFITFNSTGITFTNSTVNDTEVHFHLFNATNVMVSNVLFSNVSGNIDLGRIKGLEIDAVNLTSTSLSLLSFSVDN